MGDITVMYSRKSDEWATPADLYEKLDQEFRFTLDPCSTEENHKCPKYYTKTEDGLKQSWAGERVFCNPPYSQSAKWIAKAWEETRNPNTICVLLLPARTDTRAFHDYIMHRAEVRFIRGRLKFSGGGGLLGTIPVHDSHFQGGKNRLGRRKTMDDIQKTTENAYDAIRKAEEA